MISKARKAQICDYGLSPIISNPMFTIAATPGVAGSSRWLAPEIIDPPNKASSKPSIASKPADVFAFAMLAVEVFTGKVPFGNMKNESVVIQIASGKRPAKPQAAEQLGLTAEMWKFIEKCWTPNPNKRPTIDEVVSTWEGFVNGYVVSSSASSTSRHITSRGNNHISMSGTSGRRSQFAEPSTVSTEKHGKSLATNSSDPCTELLESGATTAQETPLWSILAFSSYWAGPCSRAFHLLFNVHGGVGICSLVHPFS